MGLNMREKRAQKNDPSPLKQVLRDCNTFTHNHNSTYNQRSTYTSTHNSNSTYNPLCHYLLVLLLLLPSTLASWDQGNEEVMKNNATIHEAEVKLATIKEEQLHTATLEVAERGVEGERGAGKEETIGVVEEEIIAKGETKREVDESGKQEEQDGEDKMENVNKKVRGERKTDVEDRAEEGRKKDNGKYDVQEEEEKKYDAEDQDKEEEEQKYADNKDKEEEEKKEDAEEAEEQTKKRDSEQKNGEEKDKINRGVQDSEEDDCKKDVERPGLDNEANHSDDWDEKLVDGVALIKHGHPLCTSETPAPLDLAPLSNSTPLDFATPFNATPFNFTVCLFLRWYNTSVRGGKFFYMKTDSFLMTAELHWFEMVVVTVDDIKFTFGQTTLQPRLWHHLCFGYNHTDTQVWLIINGEAAGKPYENHGYFQPRRRVTSEMCLGDPEPNVRIHQLMGWVAGVSVRPGQDIVYDPTSVSCHFVFSRSTLDNIIWRGHNEVLMTQYPREEICSSRQHHFWLDAPADYEQMQHRCGIMGGQLLTSYAELTPIPPSHCLKNHTSYLSWVAGGQPTTSHEGAPPQQCTVLTVDRTIDSQLCITELECSACVAPALLRYTLYGPLHKHDRYFYLRSYPNGSIYFQGIHKVSTISRRNGSWLLWSPMYSEEWKLPPGSWPVGRHPWHSGSSSITLSLTVCSPFQFSDHDGHCLPRAYRCDGKTDTRDQSDELDCLKHQVKRPDHEPVMLPYDGDVGNGISVRLTILGIEIPDALCKEIKLRVFLRLIWRDQNIQLRDLPEEDHATKLPCGKMGHPKITIDNLMGEVNPRTAIEKCFMVSKEWEYLDITDHFSGRVLDGRSAVLSLAITTDLTFECKLRLYRYPFGIHRCSVVMTLQPPYDKLLKSSNIYFSGNKDLEDYEFVSITKELGFSPASYNFINITLEMRSQYGNHLLTSFAPSVLMFVISYVTLFFPLVNFNERVMVSLTALLVLAALFAQASESYISTPYYKLIDLWYAVVMLLCFIVVICNVLINALVDNSDYVSVQTLDDTDTRLPPKKMNRKAKCCNSVILVFLFILSLLVLTVFILYANETI